MLTALRQGRVDGLRITVAVSRSLDDAPHDVYLVDLATPGHAEGGGGRFDEVPYLEGLEPVLDALGRPSTWVVEVARTHRSEHDGVGEARVTVQLATGRPPLAVGPDPDLTGAVRSAFVQLAAPAEARHLSRDEALVAASEAVVSAFTEVDASALSLTDEENHAVEGRWSLGLVLPGVARFQVQLGLVPGLPASAHVRRMPVSEVVDSIGT